MDGADAITLLRKLVTDMNETKNSIKGLSQQNNEIKTAVEQIKVLHNTFESKCDLMQQEISSLQNQVAKLETANRRNNVVIFKLPDTDTINNNLLRSITDKFTEAEITLPDAAYDSAFRIGRKKGERPVLLKLTASRWKGELFAQLAKIRASGLAISNDLTPEEREERQRKLALCKQFKDKGHDAKLKGSSIVVDDKLIPPNELQKLLSALPSPSTDSESESPAPPAATPRQSRKRTAKPNPGTTRPTTKKLRAATMNPPALHETASNGRMDKYLVNGDPSARRPGVSTRSCSQTDSS